LAVREVHRNDARALRHDLRHRPQHTAELGANFEKAFNALVLQERDEFPQFVFVLLAFEISTHTRNLPHLLLSLLQTDSGIIDEAQIRFALEVVIDRFPAAAPVTIVIDEQKAAVD
jgi:hypothetical protein